MLKFKFWIDRATLNFWFLPSALFSLSFLKLNSFHVLNGIFLLYVMIYLLEGLSKYLRGEYSLNTGIRICVSIILIYLFKWEVSSPSTDMPNNLLVLLLFMIFWDKIESRGWEDFDIRSVLIILFGFFSLTVKLSTIPLLILAMYILCRGYLRESSKNVIVTGAIVLIMLVPWFIRNIILSGYLIYPFPNIDVFDLDWKIPIQFVINEKRWIESCARIYYLHPDQVLGKGILFWLPTWLKLQNPFNKVLLLIIIVLPLVYSIFLLVYAKRIRTLSVAYRKYLILYITSLSGILFWFLAAPDFRFGYGFLTMFALLLIVPLLEPFFS